jgi:hypothetical protein
MLPSERVPQQANSTETQGIDILTRIINPVIGEYLAEYVAERVYEVLRSADKEATDSLLETVRRRLQDMASSAPS